MEKFDIHIFGTNTVVEIDPWDFRVMVNLPNWEPIISYPKTSSESHMYSLGLEVAHLISDWYNELKIMVAQAKPDITQSKTLCVGSVDSSGVVVRHCTNGGGFHMPDFPGSTNLYMPDQVISRLLQYYFFTVEDRIKRGVWINPRKFGQTRGVTYCSETNRYLAHIRGSKHENYLWCDSEADAFRNLVGIVSASTILYEFKSTESSPLFSDTGKYVTLDQGQYRLITQGRPSQLLDPRISIALEAVSAAYGWSTIDIQEKSQ